MTRVQKGALYFGLVNAVIGLGLFVGPLVTGNEDGLININHGNWFGFIATDWMHAGLHLAFGVLGVLVAFSAGLSRLWMAVALVLFAFLAVVGWTQAGLDPDMHVVRGMGFDVEGNVLHTLWTAIALFFLLSVGSGARAPRGRVSA